MTVEDKKPWWKFGYVWMVIGGPLLVMVASVITFYFALGTPDPVIENYYVKGININKTLEGKADKKSNAMAPALKARNHAATGLKTNSN